MNYEQYLKDRESYTTMQAIRAAELIMKGDKDVKYITHNVENECRFWWKVYEIVFVMSRVRDSIL